MTQPVTNFAELAALIARTSCTDARIASYADAFIEHETLAKMTIADAPEPTCMPDPGQVRAAVEMMMQTMFDVLRDTRLERYAADLAWGFAHSFHTVARRVEGYEDDAARTLGELARDYHPSESYATELEDTQHLCRTLQGCREALECMRDHAGEVYRAETGKPFSPVKGSKVSGRLTASMIEARDFLAGRARKRREQLAPEGPVVVFSGGQIWEDSAILWRELDQIHARVPEMILATTAQPKGCDAIAQAWAAARGVQVVLFRLDRSLGAKAAFVRNDRLLGLNPVEAIVCEGSGVQGNLAEKLRQAQVPLHLVKRRHQVAVAG